jgi:hypothetical protein
MLMLTGVRRLGLLARLNNTEGFASALGVVLVGCETQRCAAEEARTDNATLIASLGKATDALDAAAAEAEQLRQDLLRAQQEQGAAVHALQVSSIV